MTACEWYARAACDGRAVIVGSATSPRCWLTQPSPTHDIYARCWDTRLSIELIDGGVSVYRSPGMGGTGARTGPRGGAS